MLILSYNQFVIVKFNNSEHIFLRSAGYEIYVDGFGRKLPYLPLWKGMI